MRPGDVADREGAVPKHGHVDEDVGVAVVPDRLRVEEECEEEADEDGQEPDGLAELGCIAKVEVLAAEVLYGVVGH